MGYETALRRLMNVPDNAQVDVATDGGKEFRYSEYTFDTEDYTFTVFAEYTDQNGQYHRVTREYGSLPSLLEDLLSARN